MRTTKFPAGESVAVLGQGTWHFAETPERRDEEVASLREGLDLGMTLIDTAEMYADGDAEKIVGEAIRGRRDEVFLVTKILPHHATRRGTGPACTKSLKRLMTDRIDLYLLHWRTDGVVLREVIEAFDELVREGAIRFWGVSNFDIDDMEDLVALPGGENMQTDQVLYNLMRRGSEFDLLPWCHAEEVPIMAYSPIEQGRLLDDPAIHAVAKRHGATPAQVALAWVLRDKHVIAIPKAATMWHVHENRTALDIRLTHEDLIRLDAAFPPPKRKVALEML
jgi:diketogulonate reductase-like aldo/keto reductase